MTISAPRVPAPIPTTGAQVTRIGLLIFDGVKMLDFAGPAEVFVEANQHGGRYELVAMSPSGGPVATSVGASVGSQPAAGSGLFDTIIVAGSEWSPARFVTDDLVAAVLDLAGRTRRMASVCTGTFALAAAGLLDGRAATTHWKFTADLARMYPALVVHPDALFVTDGHLYSSGGVAAGIDLALALVEEDLGADAARRSAQGLLVSAQRGGGQSQFSSSLDGPRPAGSLVRKVVDHVSSDLRQPHTVADLAAYANVSARQLTRLFRTELDATPAEYVADVRFAAACDRIDAGFTVTEAAQVVGYSSCEVMRRAFIARVGIPPSRYRAERTDPALAG